MTPNIKNKINILVNELERLNKFEAARKIENFIQEELNYLATEHYIDVYDLDRMQNNAAQFLQNFDTRHKKLGGRPFDSCSTRFRTYCYMNAVVSFLKGLGVLAADIKIKWE